ncbi:coiled-coil domain-containing protein 27-like [Apteryx rowi]|uniref:coiled-coil domain-containing protein 27-like n=1 Tax=Apteryx rowi TaxID=308060 RepID=UPI000E1CFC10|nr:coiled-coil domain-containing protein 27-like [Apteryx rowi]XP_025941445.1 coiled-coil domain-containing protein 27-like [Apteryx rowi]
MEQKSPSKEVAEEVLSDVDVERAFQEQSEAQEQALMAKVTELQKANQELCEELQMAKNDHNMATGAISSLQRQLEIQESQLRRTKSEKETLQKELRERENQLQAMSTKFCNLREGRKHEEMMVTIEKENCSLRQVNLVQSPMPNYGKF